MASVEFLSVNPGGTPRKNTCLTDTLTTHLTEWLTLRTNRANLADVGLIHAHAAAEAPRHVRPAALHRDVKALFSARADFRNQWRAFLSPVGENGDQVLRFTIGPSDCCSWRAAGTW